MTVSVDSKQLLSELSQHEHLAILSAYVRQEALEAARARRADWPNRGRERSQAPSAADADSANAIAQQAEALSSEQATTAYGNPVSLLQTGARTANDFALLSALLGRGIEKDFPTSPETEAEVARELVWLAAHTPVNALELADEALGENAGVLWRAVARIAERPREASPEFGRTEALVAAASLRTSTAESAATAAKEAAARCSDPLVAAFLSAESRDLEPSLSGELSQAPRGPFATALLAFSLVLVVQHLARAIGRYAFAFRRPANLRLSPRGLELVHHTELLGRVLRERATLVPLSNLARVTREVKYARAGMYAGLVALVLGSYLGVGLFVDGLRVPGGSLSLLGFAVALILGGLLTDFALSSLSDSARGRCRVVVVPRKGRALCVGALDPKRADAMLATIATQARS